MTFPQLFFAAAETHAGRVFLVDEERTLTYAETARAVRRAAHRFARQAVRKGDRVALLMRNHAAFVVTWFALGALGAVVVSVNTELRGRTLRDIIEDSQAGTIMVDAELIGVLDEALADSVSAPRRQVIASSADFFAQLDGADESYPEPHASDTDPFTILYSSGTTSRPKGAISSHRAYVESAREMHDNLALTSSDRFYVFLPLYHANPQYYAVASALCAGASIAIAKRFSASRFFDDVARYGATLFTYVGSVLHILATVQPPAAGHSLRACVGGGAPADLWRTIEDGWGVRVLELYGMTETAAFVTMNTLAAARIGTVGRARRSIDVAIVAEDGSDLGPGAIGEFVIRPRAAHLIFEGYVGIPVEETLKPEGFHTGDLGTLDADGFFTFVGRLKEMIRVRGENIAPAYLEMLLRECPLFDEVAVVGVPSALGDEDLKFCAIPRAGTTGEAIEAWCVAHLPRFMRPRFIEFRSALPKTSTQKVERGKLVETEPGATLYVAQA